MTSTDNVTQIPGNITVDTTVVTALYEQIKSMVGTNKVTGANIVGLLVSAMQAVELYKGLTGDQKKALVLNALNQLIDATVSDPVEAAGLKTLVDVTLPVLINVLVSIDNGEIEIAVSNCAKNCWSGFTGCCKKQ
jgi:hypothetical protein